jgi:hypothetical protein
MRILCELNDVAFHGWATSIKKMGSEFIFWNRKNKPVFDVFDEISPHIFIGSTRTISRGLVKCLQEYPDTITLFYDSPHSIDCIDNEDLYFIDELKKELNKPDYIFNFGDYSTLEFWEKLNYKTISIMRGINSNVREDIIDDHKIFESDVCYVGDYDKFVGKFLLPLCNTKYKVKFFGNGWPVVNGVGQIKQENIPKVFKSTKIILDISQNTKEPTETPFNSMIYGPNCISNNEYIKNILPDTHYVETPQQLKDMVEFYLNNPYKNKVKIDDLTKNHSYDTRILSLLTLLKKDGFNV